MTRILTVFFRRSYILPRAGSTDCSHQQFSRHVGATYSKERSNRRSSNSDDVWGAVGFKHVVSCMPLMFSHSVGYNKAIVLKQPGKEFREMRRELNTAVGKGGAVTRDRLMQRQDLGLYLTNLLKTPDLLFEHNRWYIHCVESSPNY